MTSPVIHTETNEWALVIKPHGMPTAPLQADETGTLLGWFLERYPHAASVNGRKPVEHGLVHRLDTPTAGLVLVAKTQHALDHFLDLQEHDGITKYYTACCGGRPAFVHEACMKYSRIPPVTVSSQFRAWGPGRKEVRPVFPGDRLYKQDGPQYSTVIQSEGEGCIENRTCRVFTCSLTRGFRHQVRAHLCALGHPILGDELYNLDYRAAPMHLYATGITFSDPESHVQVSFSLPQPDRMNR